MASLEKFLSTLERKKISYALDHQRSAIMVKVDVPGERWEVEFFEDGSVEAERFVSDGEILDEAALPKIVGRRPQPARAHQACRAS